MNKPIGIFICLLNLLLAQSCFAQALDNIVTSLVVKSANDYADELIQEADDVIALGDQLRIDLTNGNVFEDSDDVLDAIEEFAEEIYSEFDDLAEFQVSDTNKIIAENIASSDTARIAAVRALFASQRLTRAPAVRARLQALLARITPIRPFELASSTAATSILTKAEKSINHVLSDFN